MQPSATTPALIPDTTDPYAREAQIFPRLSTEQATRIAEYGREEQLAAGTPVFTRGERSVDFFLVLEGAIEIFDVDAAGEERVFTTHAGRQFTGEVDLFNDREILVSGRAAVNSRVVRLPRAAFQRMVSAEPDIAEILIRAFILRRVGLIAHAQGGVTLVGPGHGADTVRLARFLTRNGYPHRLLDTEADADADALLAGFHIGADALPAVLLPAGERLFNPATPALADALGLTEPIDPGHVHDLVIVGAGPSGLAAAVYAASEGLDTVVIEAIAPGGQAGTSSKIENYLGFPTGISGQALAGRAQMQAQKFGARLAIARAATGIECAADPYRVELEDGTEVSGRAVLVASGARYRTLGLAEAERFEGAGIHYAATAMEATLCGAEEVIVVGGGNSAGQAAVFLARTAAHVHILVRADGLAATMSDYLVQRIEQSERITLHTQTEIVGLDGDERLRETTWANRVTGARETHPIGNIFLMIGAVPNTDWLRGCLALDRQGFVVTGADGEGRPLPSPYMTTKPGIFAVGDVRSGSTKRVASGVGEGSVVIAAVHQFLHPAP